jgi:hypothetical protein
LEEKREGPNGKVSGWDNRVEISKGLHNPTGHASPTPTPDTLLLLRILVQAHISRIRLSYVHASYPIYPIGPNTSLPNPQYSLCTSFSDFDDIICLSFRLDTSPTFGEHHSRIIFGDLIRVVGEVSDAAMLCKELGQHYN